MYIVTISSLLLNLILDFGRSVVVRLHIRFLYFRIINSLTNYSMSSKRRASNAELPSKKPRLEVQQTLYVHNLNDKINRVLLKHNLYLLFSTFGDVVDINMKMRGQAHVILESKEAAARALKALLDMSVFGKPLRVEFSKTKSKCIEQAEKELAEE